MDRLLQDVRYELRQVVRRPGFALIVVVTLGLGIGSTTAIFSVVNALLVAVSLLASFIPARRALRIDPTGALRQE